MQENNNRIDSNSFLSLISATNKILLNENNDSEMTKEDTVIIEEFDKCVEYIFESFYSDTGTHLNEANYSSESDFLDENYDLLDDCLTHMNEVFYTQYGAELNEEQEELVLQELFANIKGMVGHAVDGVKAAWHGAREAGRAAEATAAEKRALKYRQKATDSANSRADAYKSQADRKKQGKGGMERGREGAARDSAGISARLRDRAQIVADTKRVDAPINNPGYRWDVKKREAAAEARKPAAPARKESEAPAERESEAPARKESEAPAAKKPAAKGKPQKIGGGIAARIGSGPVKVKGKPAVGAKPSVADIVMKKRAAAKKGAVGKVAPKPMAKDKGVRVEPAELGKAKPATGDAHEKVVAAAAAKATAKKAKPVLTDDVFRLVRNILNG